MKSLYLLISVIIFSFSLNSFAQKSEANPRIEIGKFYLSEPNSNSLAISEFNIFFPVKNYELKTIKSINSFITDSSSYIDSFVYYNKRFNNNNKIEPIVVFILPLSKHDKKTNVIAGQVCMLKPFRLDFKKIPLDKIFTTKDSIKLIYIGPFQSQDSLGLTFQKYAHSESYIKYLIDEEEKKIIQRKNLDIYNQFVDSFDVLNLLKESILLGEITNENSKSGVTLNYKSNSLRNCTKTKNDNPYFYYSNFDVNGDFKDFTIKFTGSINPISGIVQCGNLIPSYDDNVGSKKFEIRTEYMIVNNVITQLRFLEENDNHINGEFSINFEDIGSFKMIQTNKENLTYAEGSFKFNEVLSKDFKNTIRIRKWMQAYRWGITSSQLMTSFISLMDSVTCKNYYGKILSNNTQKEISDELLKSKIILKRDSPISYVNSEGLKIPYFYISFNENDSLYIITKTNNLEGGKKYLEEYTSSKSSKYFKFYKNSKVDSTYSEHEIMASRIDLKSPTVHFPLTISTKRKNDSMYNVEYLFNSKKLFEAKLNIKNEIVGDAYIYSIASQLQKDYKTRKLSEKDKLDKLWKISMSFNEISNEYTSTLGKLFDFSNFNPNNSYTIGFQYLWPNMMPLATTPLGTEILINGSPSFVDRTPDYLAQKAYFNKGKIEALYVYLPDGSCYDSINLRKNEYGEQIGKSTINEFPLSERWKKLYNASQKELEAKQQKAMSELYQKLKTSYNTCDHCKKEITDQKIQIYNIDCPNGKSYMLNSIRIFCSLKCHSEYKKYWCDLQDN